MRRSFDFEYRGYLFGNFRDGYLGQACFFCKLLERYVDVAVLNPVVYETGRDAVGSCSVEIRASVLYVVVQPRHFFDLRFRRAETFHDVFDQMFGGDVSSSQEGRR